MPNVLPPGQRFTPNATPNITLNVTMLCTLVTRGCGLVTIAFASAQDRNDRSTSFQDDINKKLTSRRLISGYSMFCLDTFLPQP